jgi:ATP-dependent helicase/nuclease subunit B
MRSDADILARDAFLLQGIIASRRTSGSVWLIAGKVSDTGDPLRPSRLLLRCDDDELPERATHLFRDVSSHRSRPAATVGFQLNPALASAPAAPAAISVTAFRDYLACPFRFYLKHVLRMDEQDDWKRAPDALDFGILVHDALQRMGEDPELRLCTDARVISDFLTNRAERWVKRQYGSAPALPIRMALHAARQRLEAAALVQAQLAAEGWEIVKVEQPFKKEVGGLTVKGKIDRVDRHRDTGALRVIDYKTTDSASDPARAHLSTVRDDTPGYAQVSVAGKQKRWTDLQLPLYATLGVESPDSPPEPAYFALPRAVSDTALLPWPTFDADLAGAAFDAAEAIAAQIREGVFWPPAERVTYDEFEALFHNGAEGWKADKSGFPSGKPPLHKREM